jgi:hypothetical protein
MFGNTLDRYQAFWNRLDTDRPLWGCNIGFFVNERYPRVMEKIPPGLVRPEDIQVDLFLQDCENLYSAYQKMGDDYPYVGASFIYIPWMEAIMGCPIKSSHTSFWAEPWVKDWKDWHWQKPTLENPWLQKLLELMRALVKHADGRYPVAPTLMRGPSDMLAAMRGAAQLPLDLIDFPDIMKRAINLCAEVWIEVGKAQLALIPESKEGYVAGEHGLRTWAPDKVIWLQEDAMALLSPPLYREFFLPVDRYIAGEFPCLAFHLHNSALWAIEELVGVPEINVLELNLDDIGHSDVEGTFRGWKKIQAHKPLVMWWSYEEGFWSLLKRVLEEFPSRGLAIQVVVKDAEEGKKVRAGFLEAVSKIRQ